MARFSEEFSKADHLILFVKDPLHRIASCFQNKFIQRKGNRSIFRDYSRVTGRDPYNATFERFVRDYVAACFDGEAVNRRCDRHIYTQHQQVLPVAYDVVASVDQFDQTMESLDLTQLLTRRANATANTVAVPGAWRLTSKVLYSHYCELGQTPNRDSMLNCELVAEINKLYRADFRAFGHLFASTTV